MNGGRVLRLLLASTLLVGLAACTPCCTQDCPAIYLIHGDAEDTQRFDVLLVGDGFREDQLALFQAAAEYLVRDLWEVPPFNRDDFMQGINFYRMDVIDGESVRNGCQSVAQDCDLTLGPCQQQQVACEIKELGVFAEFEPSNEDPVTGSGTLDRDLNVRLCYTGSQHCNSLGMPYADWRRLAKLVGRTGLPIDAVIVLANTRNVAGSATYRHGGETALAVLGVPQVPAGDFWRLSPGAKNLFAHELVHTIGLYDEYGGSGEHTSPIRSWRNVWYPGVDSYAQWEQAEMELPWQSKMATGCDPVHTVPCTGIWNGTVCVPDPGTNVDCALLPAPPPPGSQNVEVDLSPPQTPCTPPPCDERAGLWEGAFHYNRGFFRSHEYCKMETLAIDFCEACKLALERLLCCYGDEPCEICPPFLGDN